jgi:hypothetical protein
MYHLQLVVVQQATEEIPQRRLKPCSKKDAKMTCSLMSSVGNNSPVAAFHSTYAFGQSSLRSPKAWIFTSVIMDRTHGVCGSGMEAVSATISPLGFALDLIAQGVLTCMRKRARHGAVVQARGWPELEVGWKHARESKAVARSRESYGGGSETDGRKKKGAALFIGGTPNLPAAVPFAVQHVLNGSIPRSLREDYGGFIANRLKPRPKF